MDLLSHLDARIAATAVELLRLVIWLVLLAAVFVPIERMFGLRAREIFRKGLLTDLGYYFLSSLAPSLVMSLPLAAVAWLGHRVVPAAVLGMIASWPLWLRIAVSLLLGEVGFYWGHRWSHEVPWLWRFHAVHHSPEHLDFLVNTRAHPVDMVFTRMCGLVPLYVVGLGAPARGSASLIPVLIVLAGTVLGFFIHANVRWRFGVLEQVVATPAFHHWHHTNDGPAVINKNYSPMLPVVDRLFGTLHLPAGEQTRTYGIDQAMGRTMGSQLVTPFLPAHRAVVPAAEAPEEAAEVDGQISSTWEGKGLEQ